ncbi:hypothetical protein TanjilG_32700 [Lupinus angustifolius]|uniref:Pectinesterase inhibitor domain-containing protein n=1 Tax=Lupinus angustifolius TaxID=3871 RepID=A0A1J7H4N4_LUPAN|nr:PREDICTED: uncharacterized protein LOC109352711 [Lupinus angustifolius]XP_019450436.1 PREDICTED: uncharacterized protein LOC109352712 [Lupinus angustifolius]OIW07840.1 hypothetical protein TanjilG_32696 [Lupinus angustifolius]OIW07842.1 hypothetical protein TanjilG_32698 [Lupinus angustifolius]OIW07844.1 hypothetical protein TanjilG_32700 [Lupinus angustifolius]
MARLACCLVLISLCLCLVLEPAFAAKKGHKTLKVKSTKHIAPASAPFPSAIQTEQALIQQLCQDTRKSKLCRKIVQGERVALEPVAEAKIAIDIATSMASRVGAYMSTQLKTNRVKILSRGFVKVCKFNYDNAIVDLNLSYINFESNTKKAIESLKQAEIKIGFCVNSLKSASKNAEIPPVHEANKVIQSLIKAAESVAKKQTH